MQGKGLWLGVGAGVLALLAAGYFLFFNKEKPQGTSSSLTSPSTSSPIPTEGTPVEGEESEVREITIEAEEYSYSTEEISVKKGEKVKLTMVNNGRMSHDFVVDDTDIATSFVGPGKSVSVEFTIDEIGSYTFFCSVGNHRALGMEGTLEVTE